MGTERITEAMLNRIIENLNKRLNKPLTAWSTVDGLRQSNIGHFMLDCTYGGFNLECISNENGGTSDPLNTGHTTKRDLYNQIHAYMRSIDEGRAERPAVPDHIYQAMYDLAVEVKRYHNHNHYNKGMCVVGCPTQVTLDKARTVLEAWDGDTEFIQ